jgi:hypothetical protein
MRLTTSMVQQDQQLAVATPIADKNRTEPPHGQGRARRDAARVGFPQPSRSHHLDKALIVEVVEVSYGRSRSCSGTIRNALDDSMRAAVSRSTTNSRSSPHLIELAVGELQPWRAAEVHGLAATDLDVESLVSAFDEGTKLVDREEVLHAIAEFLGHETA